MPKPLGVVVMNFLWAAHKWQFLRRSGKVERWQGCFDRLTVCVHASAHPPIQIEERTADNNHRIGGIGSFIADVRLLWFNIWYQDACGGRPARRAVLWPLKVAQINEKVTYRFAWYGFFALCVVGQQCRGSNNGAGASSSMPIVASVCFGCSNKCKFIFC